MNEIQNPENAARALVTAEECSTLLPDASLRTILHLLLPDERQLLIAFEGNCFEAAQSQLCEIIRGRTKAWDRMPDITLQEKKQALEVEQTLLTLRRLHNQLLRRVSRQPLRIKVA